MPPATGRPAVPPRATVSQCVILLDDAGALRSGAAPDTPTALLPCGDRPFLSWAMRERVRYGVRDFVLLAGHLADRVEESMPAIRAALPVAVRVIVSRQPMRAGTGGALFHARHLLQDRFLFTGGKNLLDGNLARLLADAAAAPELAGQLLLRRAADTSRHAAVMLRDRRLTGLRTAFAPAGPGLVSAGIGLFRRDALLPHLAPAGSLEADVLPGLAGAGALGGTPDGSAEAFFDLAVPEQLSRARAELPQRLRRPALFLDRDGVLNHDHGWVGSRDRFHWIEGAIEAVRLATEAGWHVFVVTNQSGVARGLYDEAAVQDLMGWIVDAVRSAGGTIDDYRYCPFHPDAAVAAYRRASDWRKPAPGMLLDLIRRWELDPARCHLVGDQTTDLQAAAAAGIAATRFAGGRLDETVRPLLRAGTVPPSDRP